MKWPWRRQPNIKLDGPGQQFRVTLLNGQCMTMYLHSMHYGITDGNEELNIRFVRSIDQGRI
jgi:hypothetical protein